MKVAILGAGPAGSSCAISLLKAGAEVVLVDRAVFPRLTPGETLHPGIEPLLQQLGVWEALNAQNLVRHSGIENITQEESFFVPYHAKENWQGFQLPRGEFDHLLLQKAIRLGATFMEGVRPISLSLNKNKEVISLKTSKAQLSADFYIDATGKRAWMVHQLNIPIQKHSPPRMAYYGYLTAKRKNQLPHPKITWDANGWTWMAQIKPTVISWVRLDLVFKKREKQWLPKALSTCKAIGKRKVVDVTWRIAEQLSDKNYFFIGDAAFTLDPAASHGVLKAIMSGIMVAHLLTSNTAVSLKNRHLYYHSWIKKWFRSDVEILEKLYAEKAARLRALAF